MYAYMHMHAIYSTIQVERILTLDSYIYVKNILYKLYS